VPSIHVGKYKKSKKAIFKVGYLIKLSVKERKKERKMRKDDGDTIAK
jgi:hypothetical protein